MCMFCVLSNPILVKPIHCVSGYILFIESTIVCLYFMSLMGVCVTLDGL